MIHKIVVENFFSIADSQELVFKVARNVPDLDCFKATRSDQDVRVPAVIGFFGPNASGKSTLLRAITSALWCAFYSFGWKGSDQIKINTLFQPYRQKKWWGRPTKIIIEFDSTLGDSEPSVLFRYELHIAHQAGDFNYKFILYEALSYAPHGKFRYLFKRKEQKFQFGVEFNIGANDSIKERIRPNASVLSTLVQFNHPLASYFDQMVGNAIRTNAVGHYKMWPLSLSDCLAFYAKDADCFDQLKRELRRFDLGFESMFIEQGPQGLFAKCQHVGLDDFIFLGEESQGTLRFIELFLHLYFVLKRGGVVIIDEIDTDIHPLLLPELLRWFSDPKRNPHGAQLLFTAHNPALLNELEKEQVFFTVKPSGKPSYVYGARDIQGLRREPNLMRKYLSGELGAVPHIG